MNFPDKIESPGVRTHVLLAMLSLRLLPRAHSLSSVVVTLLLAALSSVSPTRFLTSLLAVALFSRLSRVRCSQV